MRLLFLPLLLFATSLFGQGADAFIAKLTSGETVPADLLASRSVVLHDFSFEQTELETIQKSFQQTGIDAVVYFENDLILSGRDVTPVIVEYLIKREIKFLILLEKKPEFYVITITPFNNKIDFVDVGQAAWRIKHDNLKEMLGFIYGTALNNQPKKNFLINDIPEKGEIPTIFKGRRSEFFTLDLKVDKLAVPKFDDERMDKEMDELLKLIYPFNYSLTDLTIEEKDLRKQGTPYVLCFVHTRNVVAKEILGYDMTKSESALASVTYPNGALQLKAIPSETYVYKFYLRHIDSGNVYLGTKWDADVTWQEALRNHVKGFTAMLK
ncbi:MAG: hypothetical protein JJE09_06815 [Bacteroidia bacterium]|nr:hypothetical protein [Bacteroidia bacterium]